MLVTPPAPMQHVRCTTIPYTLVWENAAGLTHWKSIPGFVSIGLNAIIARPHGRYDWPNHLTLPHHREAGRHGRRVLSTARVGRRAVGRKFAVPACVAAHSEAQYVIPRAHAFRGYGGCLVVTGSRDSFSNLC